MADALEVKDIRFSYAGTPVLKGISFNVPAGGKFVIAGRSGCGKSTLLEICSSQRTPESGTVLINGDNIAGLSHDGLVRARQRIGFVFQRHALIHNFTIFDNIALPLRYHRDISEREVRAIVKASMEELGLFNVDKKFPNECTAAQACCAAIARAVVMSPQLVFLDEPTSSVDPVTARGIANVLWEMNSKRGIAIVMVCNSVEILKGVDCPVNVLDNGKLYDYKDPSKVLSGVTDLFSTLRDAL
jgi:ABC-type transporter Mla maintaining outer membrane lipid asymmetry ATPase subunit MlaF